MSPQIRKLTGRRMAIMADLAAVTSREYLMTPDRRRKAVMLTGDLTDVEIELAREIRSELAALDIEKTMPEIMADIPGMIRNMGAHVRADTVGAN